MTHAGLDGWGAAARCPPSRASPRRSAFGAKAGRISRVSALYLVIPALGIIVISYRFYSAFIAAKVMALDDARRTPAHIVNDGQNFHPTHRWVLFGHHFAAIAGPGPLLGPVLAMQFGFAPGLLWLVAGVCLAGAVHDMITLWASVRRGGASLAEIARAEIGPVAGLTAAVAILFIVIIALAGVGLAVVNALHDSPWGVFSIGMTIPLAFAMSLYMYKLRPGKIGEATVVGVIGLLIAVAAGKPIAATWVGDMLTLSREQLILSIGIYGFFASVLPVWLLLCPRDYLSSFMKVGTIFFLVVGVMIVNPTLEMPAFSRFTGGGGPIIPGALFPFAFITIACGAVSGFHSLIASGTTPKMIDKESDIRPIGYGAMLMEGTVGVMALIAAASMHPGDYFAINTPPAVFQTLGETPVDVPVLEAQIGENIEGRTGGAVSLAVGMARIFSGVPGMSHLTDYWYHFVIMFEALFILTVIDTGTRVARFLVGEFAGRAFPRMADHSWLPGAMISTAAVVAAWSYFIWTGSISTIWPMFGIANQLLATVALAVGTTVIINAGKKRYAWVTFAPMCFVATSTLWAGFLSVRDNFIPMASRPGLEFQGYLNSIVTVIMMTCVVIILASAARKWLAAREQPVAAV
jgi:carbon starvation protein